MTNLIIGAFVVYKGAVPPTKATDYAACYDIRTYFDGAIKGFDNLNEEIERPLITTEEDSYIEIHPGDRLMMPTGFIFDIPEFHSLRFHPRSGLSFKKGISLANSEGIIDPDYINQSYVLLTNSSDVTYKAKNKERLCQMEIVKDLKSSIEVIDTPPEKRGNRNGGMGHSGTH